MGWPPPVPLRGDLPIAEESLPKNHSFKLKHGPSQYGYKQYGWYDISATCEECGMSIYYGGHPGSNAMFWVWPDSSYDVESKIATMTCEEYTMENALG